MLPNPKFWRGKRVLLTGHTGFKGAWLAFWLRDMGAEVLGLALPPSTNPNLFDLAGGESLVSKHYEADIRNAVHIREIIQEFSPEIVLHLAAQALVRPSYLNPLETFSVNVMGTANVLDALRGLNHVRSVVVVTTDKVYLNREWDYPYRESDHLGGYDPYSASKAAAEMVIASYRQSFLSDQGVAVGVARAGNVIGGGDWSQDRLIPDAIRSWQADETLIIRRPDAIRPWQHVLEPISAYLVLAEKLWNGLEYAEAYNFGPNTFESATVREVIDYANIVFGDGRVEYATKTVGPHEAGILKLEVAKASSLLGIKPRWGMMESVDRTISWYRNQAQGASVIDLCREDIKAFGVASK